MPLIALLYTAIWVRVRSYGITEQRYYLILLGAWLGGISLYFIFSRSKNIKAIPISLMLIGLLSLVGPWSVFSVSDGSQLHRLERILEQNGIWQPGQKVMTAKSVKQKDALQIAGTIEYFVSRDQVMLLQPIFSKDLKKVADSIAVKSDKSWEDWARKDKMKDMLVKQLCNNDIEGVGGYYYDYTEYFADISKGVAINGYEKLFSLSGMQSFNDNSADKSKRWIFLSKNDSLCAGFVQKDNTAYFTLSRGEQEIEVVDLTSIIRSLRQRPSSTIPYEQMMVNKDQPLNISVIITDIYFTQLGQNDNDSFHINSMSVDILIK